MADPLREPLRSLRNEAIAILSRIRLLPPEAIDTCGRANIRCLQRRIDEAEAALAAPPVEQPTGSGYEYAAWKALQRFYLSLTKVDNGGCAICKVGYRSYGKNGKPSPPCDNPRCITHEIEAVLARPCPSPLDPRIAEGLAREKANGEFMWKQDEVIAKLREEIRALEIRRP